MIKDYSFTITKDLRKVFSKIAKDWQYVLTYQCANKSQALAVEKFVKQQKSRKFNERLIASPELLIKIINDKEL